MLAEETLLNSQSNRALTCHRDGSAPSLDSASQPAQPLESVWAAGTANPSTSFQLSSRLPWRGGWEGLQINPSWAPGWDSDMSHTPSQPLPTFSVVEGCHKEVAAVKKNKQTNHKQNILSNSTPVYLPQDNFICFALCFSHKELQSIKAPLHWRGDSLPLHGKEVSHRNQENVL